MIRTLISTVRRLRAPRLSRLAAVLALTVIAAACEHKPLCWHHPHTCQLKIDFGWEDAPQGLDVVTSMAVYIYPHAEGEQMKRIVFPGTAGGIVTLMSGDYDFVCLNADTESLLYNGTGSHGTFTVSTPDDNILSGMNGRDGDFDGSASESDMKRAEGTYDERVTRQAEESYGHGITDFTVHGEEGVIQVVTLYPKALTVHYHIIIENVGCIEDISKVSGTLSGLAGEVMVHNAEHIGDHCIVPFGLQRTDDTTLEGHFIGFTHCPQDITKFHKLAVYAITQREDHRFFEYDVTEQVHEQDGEVYVTIIVTQLDMCATRDMDIVVDPWIPVPDIVIKM